MELNKIELSKLGEGALQERFETELEKVIENINDINTPPHKKRKITLNLSLYTNDTREMIFAEIDAKSTLVPLESTGLLLVNGINNDGERVVSELKSGLKGQMYLDDDGDVKNDDGSHPEESDKFSKITNLYK